jgi:[ribosomal protein S18]-alanine N-acetyltransferase
MFPDELDIQPLTSEAQVSACARMMAESEPWLTLGRGYEDSLAILQDHVKERYVALVGGQVAGFLILDMRGPLTGYIQTICVRPDLRGHSIGTGLIAWAEERIGRESPNVFMCVSSFNEAAQRLYSRLGYEVVGRLADFLVPGHDEVLLRKTTGPWSSYLEKPVTGT